MPGIITSSRISCGRLLALEDRHSLFGGPGLEHRVALELEARAHVLAHVVVVVDDQDGRAGLLSRAGPGALEELVEVGAPVPAMSARRVEGRDPPLVGPFPDRALRDAEVLGGLAEGKPVGLGRRCSTSREVAVGHSH